jgi:hypothetical protein
MERGVGSFDHCRHGVAEEREGDGGMSKQVLLLTVAVLLVAGSAWAGTYGTITMTYENDNFPNAGAGSQSPPSAVLHIANSVADGQGVLVGGSNFVVGSNTGDITDGVGGGNSNPFDGQYGNTIRAYCVDVYAWISYNTTTTWDVNPLQSAPQGGNAPDTMGLAKAKVLAELADKYLDATHINSAATAAAFQASVWEIVNEALPTTSGNEYSLEGGLFSMTGWSDGTVAGIADGWLHSLILPGNDPAGRDFSFVSAGQSGTQDFGYLVQNQSAPPVPEPVTMFSAFMAISGLGVYIRRRMKVSAAA